MSILPNATFISPGNGFYGSAGASSGVTSIVAGTGITIAPTTGVGAVTINATAPASGFFRGMIMPYVGTTAPSADWAICDGTTAGVPDLRGLFIIGTSATYAFGSSGGAASQTLTLNMIPDHTHDLNGQINATNAAVNAGSGISTCGPGGTSTGISNAGYVAGTPVPTLPPYYSLTYIMKL